MLAKLNSPLSMANRALFTMMYPLRWTVKAHPTPAPKAYSVLTMNVYMQAIGHGIFLFTLGTWKYCSLTMQFSMLLKHPFCWVVFTTINTTKATFVAANMVPHMRLVYTPV